MEKIISLENLQNILQKVKAYIDERVLTDAQKTWLGKRCNSDTELMSFTSFSTLASKQYSDIRERIIVKLSASASLNIPANCAIGEELHMLVYNSSSSSSITIAIPTTLSGKKVASNVDNLELGSNMYGEINIIFNKSNCYVRAANLN